MKSRHVIAILLLLVAVLYVPFLGNTFISDDIAGLVTAAPGWTWLSSVGWPNYVHLFSFFQYLLYHIFGIVPWPFRLLNILFHAGSVILVYFIGKKLVNKRVAIVASLLFAVHPLVTESVTWISGGIYAQQTFFLLLSLWLYMNASSVICLAGRRVYHLVVSLFLFSLCLLTSEKAMTLSLLFVAYEWFFGDIRRRWKRWLPYLAVSGIFVVFYGLKIGNRITSVTAMSYQTSPWFYNPLTQIPLAISSYMEMFLWPVHLTFYHSSLIVSWWIFGIRAAVTILYGVFLVYTWVTRKPVGFWLSWFLIGLAPTLTPLMIAWIVAERYVYCSLIGFCIIAGILFDRIVAVKKLAVIGMCLGIVVVLALVTRTMLRNSEWRTADSLWAATLRESPENPESWNNMGDVYSRYGQFDKSIEAFTQASRLNPNFAAAYHNIGTTYVKMKKYNEAVPYFKKALSIDPNLWQSYQNLAFIASEKKEYQQALEYINHALKISPTEPMLLQDAQMLHRAILGQ